MLPDRPWKLEAIARLGISVLSCMFAGSLLTTALYVASQGSVPKWKFVTISTVSFMAFGATLVSLRRPWSRENFMPRAIICLISFYVALTFMAWAESVADRPSSSFSSGQMILSLAGFQGAAILLIHQFLKESATRWTEAFGLSNRWQIAVLWGIIAGALFVQIGLLLQRLSVEAMTHLPIPIQPEEQDAVQTLRRATSLFDRFVLGAGTIILAPMAEETLFRGILYPAIKRAGFPRLALWVTSLVFALIHANIAIFVPLFALAVVLVFLYEYTGNLLAPIAAHAIFNALNFTRLYLSS